MTRPSRIQAALVALAAAALLYVAMPDPAVRAAVGAHLRDVRDASSYRFDFSDLDDWLPYGVQEPVTFVYEPVGPGVTAGHADSLRFTFPPTTYAVLSQRAARIYQVKVSPQLRSLPLDEAYARMEEVAAAIAEAPGWTRAGRPTPTLAVLREYYAGDPPNRTSYFGTWEAGGTEMVVTMKRSAEADREYPEGYPERHKATEDRFIIDVDAYNSELREEYDEMVDARRRAAGDVEEPLPIQVWLDER